MRLGNCLHWRGGENFDRTRRSVDPGRVEELHALPVRFRLTRCNSGAHRREIGNGGKLGDLRHRVRRQLDRRQECVMPASSIHEKGGALFPGPP